MTKEDVIRIFGTEHIKLSSTTNVSAEDFLNIAGFSELSSNPSYQEFIDFDNGELGYKSFFDECKEQGILN